MSNVPITPFAKELAQALEAIPQGRNDRGSYSPDLSPRFFEYEHLLAVLGYWFIFAGVSLSGLQLAAFSWAWAHDPRTFSELYPSGLTLLEVGERFLVAGLLLTLTGIRLLIAVLRRMRRCPSEEMQAWLEIYRREFSIQNSQPPATRLEFAWYVQDAYDRSFAVSCAGSLAALTSR